MRQNGMAIYAFINVYIMKCWFIFIYESQYGPTCDTLAQFPYCPDRSGMDIDKWKPILPFLL